MLRRTLVVALVCADVAVWTLAVSTPAFAYTAPTGLTGDYSTVCPPRPVDPAAGADPVVAQLVELRQADADACVRREQLAAAATAAAATAAADQRAATAATTTAVQAVTAKLGGTLNADVGNWPATGTTDAQPLFTSSSTADPATAGVLDVGHSLQSDLWFVVGLGIMLWFGGFMIRRLLP